MIEPWFTRDLGFEYDEEVCMACSPILSHIDADGVYHMINAEHGPCDEPDLCPCEYCIEKSMLAEQMERDKKEQKRLKEFENYDNDSGWEQALLQQGRRRDW